MPNFRHDTGTFVAQDGGEDTLGICARECVVVGVATRCFDLDEHLASSRTRQVHFFNAKGAPAFRQ
jgi:hypothetical protein